MALFQWTTKPWGGAEIGDKRRVLKWVLLPKKLGDEWRWLGLECIEQEHMRWIAHSPAVPRGVSVRGWRDVAWAPKTGKGRS